jgi:serine/threonine protein phosphatase PrpC
MGGAEDGAAIAEAAVETARLALAAGHSRSSAPASLDPAGADAEAFSQVVAAIGEVSRDVWARHREAGGATLIACRAWADRLWFAAVGDSSLFLRRADRLFELNRRHEHRLDLWRRVLNGALPLADAEADPQVEALTSFIGCERLTVDRTAAPIMLEPGDTLLVCSDGVSDTLAVGELRSLLGLEPRLAADAISHRIEAAAVPGQDNYTAVVARHNQPATTERPV